jgi:hypothetical protein
LQHVRWCEARENAGIDARRRDVEHANKGACVQARFENFHDSEDRR